ncbi:fibronectin type III domain-containing protein [Paenibacillus hodogayensis]|uniref:Fibronectin type III domain-containing protein n=1 Tax=Paenibacillus hodogayensis TaxID=279208 RepID=A0ABV5W0Z1_9BACL
MPQSTINFITSPTLYRLLGVVVLDNGWIVALHEERWWGEQYYDQESGQWYWTKGNYNDVSHIFRVSKDNGNTWSQLCYANETTHWGATKGGIHAVGNQIAAWWSDDFGNGRCTWFDGSSIGNVHVGVNIMNTGDVVTGASSVLSDNGRLIIFKVYEQYDEEKTIFKHNVSFVDPWSGATSGIAAFESDVDYGRGNNLLKFVQRADGWITGVVPTGNSVYIATMNPSIGANISIEHPVMSESGVNSASILKNPSGNDLFIIYTNTTGLGIWRSSDGASWDMQNKVRTVISGIQDAIITAEVYNSVITVYYRRYDGGTYGLYTVDITWNGGNSYSVGNITQIDSGVNGEICSTYQKSAGRGKNKGVAYRKYSNSEATFKYYGIQLNQPPTAPTPTGPAHGGVYNYTPAVTWIFNDPDPGDYQGWWAGHILDANGSIIRDSGRQAGQATSWVPSPPLPSGSYRYRIITQDQHGAHSPYSWEPVFYVDIDPPFTSGHYFGTASPTNASSGYLRYGWTYSDNMYGQTAFQVVGSYDGWQNWHYNSDEVWTSNWYVDIPFVSLAEGNWQFAVRVRDGAGNWQVWQGFNSFAIDRTPPTISSVQNYSYINQTTGTKRVWVYGAYDANSGIQMVYCNYTVPGQAATNSVQCGQTGSDWYIDIPLSVQGEYRADFYCIDKAGNWMIGTKTAYFFVDSQRPNDPHPSAVWSTTTVELTWSTFSDPAPSSGRQSTDLYFGEWDGSNWIGAPMYYGTDIGDITSKTITGLTPGKRYRYTVTYHDKSGNESAYTYFEFVTKKQIGAYSISTRTGRVTLPLYDPLSGVVGPTPIRACNSAGAVGVFELVSTTEATASPVRVGTPSGIRAISK